MKQRTTPRRAVALQQSWIETGETFFTVIACRKHICLFFLNAMHVNSLTCSRELWEARSWLYRRGFLQEILVAKLLKRSTRFTHFCTAQNSNIQQHFAQVSSVFIYLVLNLYKNNLFTNFCIFFGRCNFQLKTKLMKMCRILRILNCVLLLICA